MKAILNAQAPLGPNFWPLQFVAAANGAATVALVMVSATVPVFFTVTFWAVLTAPTNWFPKLRLVGVSDACWAVARLQVNAKTNAERMQVAERVRIVVSPLTQGGPGAA